MPLITTSPLREVLPPISLKTLGTTGSQNFWGITRASSGDLYVVGETNSEGLGSKAGLIVKYNSSGAVTWQRNLSGSGSDLLSNVEVNNSTGDIYVTGTTDSEGAGSQDILIAKYNSSGAIQWQRLLGQASSGDFGKDIVLTSGGDPVVLGQTNSNGPAGGGADIIVTRYSSTGTFTWQRNIGAASTESGGGIAIDGSDNIYITGHTQAAQFDILFAKLNSSGVIQYQNRLYSFPSLANDFTGGSAIASDSSGNIYFTGYSSQSGGAGGVDMVINKANSSGAIQWKTSIGDTGSDIGISIFLDGSFVYTVGSTTTYQGAKSLLITKHDIVSGTLQWQRAFGAAFFDEGNDIVSDGSGNLYMVGRTSSTTAGVHLLASLMVFPDDGSGTDVYSGYTYGDPSFTVDTDTNMGTGSLSLTNNTTGFTQNTPTLTDAASTLTETSVI